MKTTVTWKDGMAFEGLVDSHRVTMDAKAPLGKGSGATPKEFVAIGLGGCTAMDVIALLKKHKQSPSMFKIDVEIKPSSGKHPIVFETAELTFVVEGDIDTDILIESVKLSQTKFCGVSAMLSKAFPITYKIVLNGSEIATDKANFNS